MEAEALLIFRVVIIILVLKVTACGIKGTPLPPIIFKSGVDTSAVNETG